MADANNTRTPTGVQDEAMKAAVHIFWSRVKKSDGCWEWSKTLLNGYGVFKYHKKMIYAHRFSYALHNGTIPVGQCVCHHCDNPKCVRPDHLFLGTKSENCHDRHGKGRTATKESHGCAKLNSMLVAEIRQRWAAGAMRSELAKEYRVSWSLINLIVKGILWKSVERPAEAIHTS